MRLNHWISGAGIAASCWLLAACGDGAAEQADAAAGDGWRLVWSDEFDGDTLDTAAWNRIEDCWGGGNEERQCYTARAENIAVENGLLVLTAREEEWSGNAWPPHMAPFQDDPDAQATKPFTSGKITTAGNFGWTYGRFEMRARLPQGQGTWPAFWMLPEDDTYGTWASAGEIDILEAVNLGVECDADCEEGGENTILGTLHFGGEWPDNELYSTEVERPAVLDGEFHTYGLVWEEGRFTWTFDGEPFATAEAEDWFTTASDDPNAPFDRPFHLILNLAVGGGLAEGRALGGVSNEGFSKQMEVDWVRVWQCDTDPETGRGCMGGS
ncbi:glycoside hydrolase family 16 protein [Aurantiacibacter sp. D1-12]|uniref:glycoside hydrolase family 16 protein n=1 Tax=Aurantiacibacter sp. D1-12 TaxID=2993658 RepID=UPI00237C8766|nr:glycoside hydrolase family 16 protein [Aurantiacibacter sp. D1-12]MDE1467600.1 glycoside hydrolase family 16 protein [Aurantiacibacter sp. D1-12]